jgi:hypothetical protein
MHGIPICNHALADSTPSPPAVSGERVGVRGLRYIQRHEDGAENVVRILKNIVVPKSQHPESESLQVVSATLVIGKLVEMLTSIDLDDDSALETDEIEDVASHAMLTAELHSELGVAQVPPQQCFRVRLRLPEAFRVIHTSSPSPCPLPQKKPGGEGSKAKTVKRRIRFHLL